MPLGEPKLRWSFNREGECAETLERDRNEAMSLDVDAKRAQRQQFVELAHPQRGVDAMKDRFTGTTSIPGVVDRLDDDVTRR